MVVSRLLSRFKKNYIYGFHSHLIKKKCYKIRKRVWERRKKHSTWMIGFKIARTKQKGRLCEIGRVKLKIAFCCAPIFSFFLRREKLRESVKHRGYSNWKNISISFNKKGMVPWHYSCKSKRQQQILLLRHRSSSSPRLSNSATLQLEKRFFWKDHPK